MDWFLSLDPPTRQLLFGGITAQVANRILGFAGYGVRKAFARPAQQTALQKAIGCGLLRAAEAAAGGDPDLRDHCFGVLGEWVEKCDTVAGEVSGLLEAPPVAPDIRAMRHGLHVAGFDPDTLSQHRTFEDLWGVFTREFANAAGQDPELQGALQVRLLQQIAAGVAPLAEDLHRIADTVAPDPKPARRRYLEYLARTTGDLPLLGLDAEAANAQNGAAPGPRLTDVYVALKTTAAREPADSGQIPGPRHIFTRSQLRVEEPVSVLEAFVRQRRMVLLGDPGGGKSTCVNHLVHCLARGQIDPAFDAAERLADLPEEWRKYLPVRVLLREMAAWIRESNTKAEKAGILEEYLRAWMRTAGQADFFQPAWDTLQAGRAILLLDGWDEVSEGDAAHPRIKAMLTDLPSLAGGIAECPTLVTCRVRTYEEEKIRRGEKVAPWRLASRHWPACSLREFDKDQIDGFVNAWYGQLLQRGVLHDAPARADVLKRAVRRPDLRPMAGNPLLLTMMAIDHADKGELPDARSVVYEDLVDLLLWKWRRVEKQEQDSTVSLRDLQRQGEWQETDLRRLLAEVAFEAHEAAARSGGQPAVPAAALRRRILEMAPPGNDAWGADDLLTLIRLRSGLLVPAGSDTFAFPHRTFQEYLAACHLCSQGDVAGEMAARARAGAFWREVILLGINRLVHQYGETARPLAVVSALCPPEAPAAGDEARWRDVAMAGACLAEIGAARYSKGEGAALAARVKQRLAAILEGERLDVPRRVRAGSVLGALGDPRDLGEWVGVEAGPFLMGEKQQEDNPPHEVTVDAFEIRKYPVTNQEYAEFVAETGRQAPEHWGGNTPPPELRNHPVVHVTWEDADAYCRWAGASLPTEAQWEKAARGTDGRTFPWGNDWDRSKCRCSTEQGPAEGTAPVGAFPSGASPFGCLDMAGNVSEWCADYAPRGSAWNCVGPSGFRCADSFGLLSLGGRYTGFRAARSPR